MKVAYEHVRIAPKGDLANELMLRSLEDELSSANESETVATMEMDESPETVNDIGNVNNANVVCKSQQRMDDISRDEEEKNEAGQRRSFFLSQLRAMRARIMGVSLLGRGLMTTKTGNSSRKNNWHWMRYTKSSALRRSQEEKWSVHLHGWWRRR